MLAFDPIVVGAGVPAFEQRGDPMRARKRDVARFRRLVAGDVLVGEALLGENPEHPGTVGVGSDQPGAAVVRAKSTSCKDPGASATPSRTRPSRSFRFACLPRFSTAIMTGTLSVEAPSLPVARPPTNDSSTSTTPQSCCAVGRAIARRSLCSHAHAVSVGAQAEHVVHVPGRGAVLL